LPYWTQAPIVGKVTGAFDCLQIAPVVFDWMNWDEGEAILHQYKTFDFKQLKVISLCKLLTAIIRSDRFCEGSLVSSFKNGTILKILTAMQDRVKQDMNLKAMFDRAAKKDKPTGSRSDKILGCLVGGAVGDALGYPVEFMSNTSIRSKYGQQGITRYELNSKGIAEISDDTQMTLFTASGLLDFIDNSAETPENAITNAYLQWYQTQTGLDKYPKSKRLGEVSELNSRRAPGNTCLSALQSLYNNQPVANKSKGCGGVMRVAPIAFLPPDTYSVQDVEKIALEAAKLTHKHPLGFLPAAVSVHIIYINAATLSKRLLPPSIIPATLTQPAP